MNPVKTAAAVLSYHLRIKAAYDLISQPELILKMKLLGLFIGALSAADVFFDDQGRQSEDGNSWRALDVDEKGPGKIFSIREGKILILGTRTSQPIRNHYLSRQPIREEGLLRQLKAIIFRYSQSQASSPLD